MTTKIRIINFGPKPITLNTAAAQAPFTATAPLNATGAVGQKPDVVYPGGISGDMYVFDTQSVIVQEVP